ncbi:uncharacterized protein PHALS_15144 [Plasmopara halstedii]|uniref:Uncharacterized protein n=1 Tax=Plasmopara halstedii TaxID=4781 RepID=A0A0P1B2P0_PLAHL|nr:uncharacterized protein PHALS_15144 [Plasmopara halstedii]CEG48313.1 hypothetical protein PHALS_15144 [Plasmopara halstedii]|eukprot:XP_024584682.1 hypothetical protein PHALS_15144 [Plasmopara halstedii]
MVGSQNRDIQSSFRRSRCARKSFLLLILGFNFIFYAFLEYVHGSLQSFTQFSCDVTKFVE